MKEKFKMKILVADDERDIADALEIILKYSGFESDIVYNGVDAWKSANENVYDGIILDIMMPGMSGMEVLNRLREEGDMTPVLMLTAKSQVEDKISGLNMGADDYLSKPFDKGELIARVNVMLRRKNIYDNSIIDIGNTTLDVNKLELKNGDVSLRLAGREVSILEFLMRNQGKYVDEMMLEQRFWENDEYETGAVELYMGYLKNKLKSIKSDLKIVVDNEKGCKRICLKS